MASIKVKVQGFSIPLKRLFVKIEKNGKFTSFIIFPIDFHEFKCSSVPFNNPHFIYTFSIAFFLRSFTKNFMKNPKPFKFIIFFHFEK